jgi:hypothetical protein
VEPGRVCVPAPVRRERDPAHGTQPRHQVIRRRVGHRAAGGSSPQTDEHVVRIDSLVLAVQVIGIQPHQRRSRRDHPAPAALGPHAVRLVSGDHAHQTAADVDVLMPHAQGLPDPQAGLQQHRQQQPVPQMTAGIQDRLGFRHGQHPRQRPGSFHLHRQPRPGTAPGHVIQERAERRARIAAARSLDGPQHPGRLRPVAGVEPVKRRHRRELAVHRRCPAVMRLLAQHGDRPVPALRRQPQPRDEPGDVLQGHLIPGQATAGQITEPVLQVMGIRLHRVRRFLRRAQEPQEPVHRPDRAPVTFQNRPRHRIPRHHHTLHAHRIPLSSA